MKFLFMLLLFMPLAHADEREECQLAIVEDHAGNAVVISADGKGAELEDDHTLVPGDLLKTGKDAWVDLRLCDGSAVRVGEQTKFYYEGASQERESFLDWAFSLMRGSMQANVNSDGTGERIKMRIKTPNAAMGIRGTEFVVDSNEETGETNLHTLEGEVLMGHVDDFEKLKTLRGSELMQQFEPVGKEKMSVLRKGERKPLKAAAFKVWEFRSARKQMLERPLHKRGWTEIRQHFKDNHQRHIEKLKAKGIFERPREKIEKRMQERGQKLLERRQERAAEKQQRREVKATAKRRLPKRR